jgi:hypothetical protein
MRWKNQALQTTFSMLGKKGIGCCKINSVLWEWNASQPIRDTKRLTLLSRVRSRIGCMTNRFPLFHRSAGGRKSVLWKDYHGNTRDDNPSDEENTSNNLRSQWIPDNCQHCVLAWIRCFDLFDDYCSGWNQICSWYTAKWHHSSSVVAIYCQSW